MDCAWQGVARFYKSRKKHIITTQTEHKCVLDSCRSLETEGFHITYLPVKKSGLIDLKVSCYWQKETKKKRFLLQIDAQNLVSSGWKRRKDTKYHKVEWES